MSAVAPVLSGTSEFDQVALNIPVATKSTLEITQQFNLPLVVEEINANSAYRSIALQFPDDLLKYSTQIAEYLQQNVSASIYVLADTSYSPCCVDEISAQHVAADIIIHFGNTCLNPVRNIPVIYVLDNAEAFDLQRLADNFKRVYPDVGAHVLLLADSQYTNAVEALHSAVKDSYTNVIPTYLEAANTELVNSANENETTAKATYIPKGSVRVSGRTGVSTELPDTDSETFMIPNRGHSSLKASPPDYSIFYLSSSQPSSSLLLYLSTNFPNITLHDMASYKTSSPYLNLRKRYKYMNDARSAGTIGILVNTLSLKNLDTVLKKVQQSIVAASKKYYTFVVGKPNVPKLANFDVVDVWVILGCSIGGIVVDSDDYYKPIITPYELSLALKRELTWDGRWLIDFDSILKLNTDEHEHEHSDPEDEQGSDLESDAPEFDPVTGKYVSSSRPLRRRIEHVDIGGGTTYDDENQLATRLDKHLVIKSTTSTAAEYLNEKTTWKGLGENHEDFDVNSDPSVGAGLEHGRQGIARGYKVDGGPKT